MFGFILTSHAIVGESLTELIDDDEKNADRVSEHGSVLLVCETC